MRIIYLSYAPEDYEYGKNLSKRLNAPTFQETYQSRCWSTPDIVPGAESQLEMVGEMGRAFLFVPLVSPDYFFDEECYAEMMAALRLKEEKRLAHILPILLRPTEMEGHPLEKITIYPRKQGKLKALTTWKHRDEAWQQAQQGIVRLLTGEQDDTTHLPQLC